MTAQSALKTFWNAPYTFWAMLTLPAIPMILGLSNGGSLHRLLHPTGEWSTRLMIISLALTPLLMLFPQSRAIRWLMRRRRYIGVAAFGYAALHTLAYVANKSPALIASEFLDPALLTGWLAFFIFVPLALTSNDASIRAMGLSWKPLQRLVYAAAILTIAHWVLLEYSWGGALVHFVPLAALEAYRLWRNFAPWRAPA